MESVHDDVCTIAAGVYRPSAQHNILMAHVCLFALISQQALFLSQVLGMCCVTGHPDFVSM